MLEELQAPQKALSDSSSGAASVLLCFVVRTAQDGGCVADAPVLGVCGFVSALSRLP